MILAIDIGNTNIVIGCIDKNKVYFTARTATDRTKTEDQYGIQIKNILELYSIERSEITGGIISSVVPPVSNAIKSAVAMVIGKQPLIVGPGVKNGLNIVMDNPASVGSDLIVNAVAALAQHKPPMIIIDMGTATTLSVIDENKNYIGGCIIPGVKISIDALSSRTAQLPAISLESPKHAIGKNTVDCMRSGVLYGNAAMIDGMIERLSAEIGGEGNVTAIATGGLAKVVIPHCRHEIIIDDELLLKGLYIIYCKNQ
ncbi:MAG: type III pantothenate kinase [Firmicutes bacterium]|nr:type III pantothenate kinase [Bacillota bacterium]